ncbi:MAG: phenylalanine--tRNA ligase subunit alpha [Bacteroidetes bacterium]|nr:MAG: phenylalanine--tRNA ligase subunit alpha [Bacteroidota bacterium]
MKSKITQYLKEVNAFNADSIETLEAFRIKYLSKKGLIPALFADFKTVLPEERKEVGQLINGLKNAVQEKIVSLKETMESATETTASGLDLTLPVESPLGSRHPLSVVRNEIIDIFSRIGFTVSEGPEIEDDFHNFTALNFPPDHPARDMQDTFFIEKDPDIALRTHTSSVQVRVMENAQPPLRTISPGRVFRNEAISARAHCIFHQVEGLYVDTDVSFADLKQTLFYFARELFGEHTKIRFRPSYFPFTEPSAEMDVSCNICGGKGCNVCKYTGWVEILGCGMVDPNVLDNCNIDSKKYTGFAFGMGIERITMLKYRINDLRLFFENDIRFLKQFESAI